MQDLRKIAWFDKALWVTTDGRVLKIAESRSGVIVWDETGKTPLLAIDEASDDAGINVYLHPAGTMMTDRPNVWEMFIES